MAPPERVASVTLRAPARAKNRQGLFLKGSELCLFGGNQSLGQHDFDEQNFLTEAQRLNLASLEFEPFASFPVARQSMQTAVVGDTGYAIGGFSPEQGKLATQADVFVYDFEADSWTRAQRGLPESLTQFGLTEHGGALWIFGGLNFGDSRQEQFRHLSDVLLHDLSKPDSGLSYFSLEYVGGSRAACEVAGPTPFNPQNLVRRSHWT